MDTPPLNLPTWLLAFSPIAVVLLLMVGFRWGGKKAGPVGWVVAMGVAWLFFGAGPEVLLASQLRGILLSLYVLYIIWMALVLYRVVDEAGAITVIGQGIARLTAEPTMQLLLLAWAFSAFLQGVAGFGVPIAVVAPLLIGMGFAPVISVAAVAIGHSWSVTFGDIASSFQALMAATGLPGQELAPWSSLFLGLACFGCGIAAAWILDGRRSLRQGWPALLSMGVVMAAVQAGLALAGQADPRAVVHPGRDSGLDLLAGQGLSLSAARGAGLGLALAARTAARGAGGHDLGLALLLGHPACAVTGRAGLGRREVEALAAAGCAGYGVLELQGRLGPEDGIPETDPQTVGQVASPPRAGLKVAKPAPTGPAAEKVTPIEVRSSLAPSPEQVAEHLLETGAVTKVGPLVTRPAKGVVIEGLLTQTVILRPFGFVSDDVVCLGDLLELFLGLGVAGIHVRMMLPGQ